MTLIKKNLNLGLSIFLLGALVFNVFRYKKLVTNYTTLSLNCKAFSDSITAQYQDALDDKIKLEKGQIFNTMDVVDTEGKALEVPNQEAKVKMIVFSSSTCPNCDTYHPILNNFANTHADIDIVVLQYDTNPEEQQKELKDKKYEFALVSTSLSVLDSLNVVYTPTTVILNKENKVDTVLIAHHDLEQLNQVVAKL